MSLLGDLSNFVGGIFNPNQKKKQPQQPVRTTASPAPRPNPAPMNTPFAVPGARQQTPALNPAVTSPTQPKPSKTPLQTAQGVTDSLADPDTFLNHFNSSSVYDQRTLRSQLESVAGQKDFTAPADISRSQKARAYLDSIDKSGVKASGNVITFGQDLVKGINDTFATPVNSIADTVQQSARRDKVNALVKANPNLSPAAVANAAQSIYKNSIDTTVNVDDPNNIRTGKRSIADFAGKTLGEGADVGLAVANPASGAALWKTAAGSLAKKGIEATGANIAKEYAKLAVGSTLTQTAAATGSDALNGRPVDPQSIATNLLATVGGEAAGVVFDAAGRAFKRSPNGKLTKATPTDIQESVGSTVKNVSDEGLVQWRNQVAAKANGGDVAAKNTLPTIEAEIASRASKAGPTPEGEQTVKAPESVLSDEQRKVYQEAAQSNNETVRSTANELLGNESRTPTTPSPEVPQQTTVPKVLNDADKAQVLAKMEEMRAGGRTGEVVNPETAAAQARTEVATKVAALSDTDFVKQISDRYGLQPATTARLMKQTTKADLFNKLEDNSEFIRGADVPDAAATSILKKAVSAGDKNPTNAALKNNITEQRLAAETAPTDTVTPQTEAPRVSSAAPAVNDSPLGNIVKDHYADPSKKVDFEDAIRLGESVAAETDKAFKAIGSDTATVFAKVQELARELSNAKITPGKVADREVEKLMKEFGLTDAEIGVMKNVSQEMSVIRDRAKASGRKVDGGDLGRLYLPQRDVTRGESMGSLLDGFVSERPGNEIRRTNAIELKNLDYSSSTVGSYITRYADKRAAQVQNIAKSLEGTYGSKDVPMDPTIVHRTANEIANVQDRINGSKKRAFGTTTNRVNSSAEFSKIGKGLGLEQTVVTAKPGHELEIGNRVNGVQINNVPAGDYMGLNQYRDAGAYTSSQAEAHAGDRSGFVDAVQERLRTGYDLPEEKRQAFIDALEPYRDDLLNEGNISDELFAGRVQRIYEKAANEQFIHKSMTTDIKDARLNRDISDLANQHLRGGTIKDSVGSQAVRAINMTRNSAFRKLNVSSAMNELSDLPSFVNTFGITNMQWKPDFSTLERYAQSGVDPASQPFLRELAEAGGNAGKVRAAVTKALKTANDATNFYHAVEHYKAAVALSTAEKVAKDEGLTGDALTARVLDDYRKVALPVDNFSRTFVDHAPLLTQYLGWQLRNTAKEAKQLTGQFDAGILRNKSVMGRVARNAYANIPAKTVLWLGMNGLKATPLITALGLTDFTGMSGGDFSGIDEKDKNQLDGFVNWAGNTFTFASLPADMYDEWRISQLNEEHKNDDYNPYAKHNATDAFGQALLSNSIPGYGQISKTQKAADEQNRGFTQSGASSTSPVTGQQTNDGRVKYATGSDPFSTAQGLIFGNGSTGAGRQYSGDESAIQQVTEGKNPLEAGLNSLKTDGSVNNIVQGATGKGTRDYQSPLSSSTIDGGYNKAARDDYSEAEAKYGKGSAKAKSVLDGWVSLGRKYNSVLKDFQKNDPGGYSAWQKSMGDDVISPEKWDIYQSHPEVFQFAKSQKALENRDLGRPIDPIFKLNNTAQIKDILFLRSAATGDDKERREILKATAPWYNQFTKDQSDYYDKLESNGSGGGGSDKSSDRVKAYNTLGKNEPQQPDLVKQYYQVKNDKGDDAAKAFYKANGDALSGAFDSYKQSQFDWTNKRRALEGHDPLDYDTFTNSSYGFKADAGSSSSKSGSGYSKNPAYLDGSGSIYRASTKGPAKPKGPKTTMKKASAAVKHTRAKSTSPFHITI